MQNFRNLFGSKKNLTKSPATFCTRVSLISSLLISLLLVVLLGLPENPFSIIANIKGKKEKRESIALPLSALSGAVSVKGCSEAARELVYSSATDFAAASAGLKVFQSRVVKEFKAANKSFNKLAQRVLNQNIYAFNQTQTCLLPLMASVKQSQSLELPSAELLAVSLGTETL